MNRNLLVILATGLALAACAPMAQRPAIDPALESGVTSSNGGGQRQLGNTNATSIGPNGPVASPSSGAGRAY